MAGAVRASATDFNSAVDTTLAPSLAVNAGELLVFQLSDRDASVAISSIVSSLGNTYVLSRAAQISGNFRAVQYSCVSGFTGTDTVTMTFGGTGVRGVATLSACTGMDAAGAIETSGGLSNAAGTAHSCGSINAVAGLTFATFNFSGDEGAKTHTGYTEITNAHAFLRDYFSYRVNPGAETITSTVTTTNSPSGVGYHVNYREAIASGARTKGRATLLGVGA